MLPLDDVKVLDFSFHLPGPLASLILAEAGAEVVKVERPDTGDELRLFPPMKDGESLSFAVLNRGKYSVAVDLKAPGALKKLTPLIRDADVIVEQFRPGVMDRLGLGYETLLRINPRLIYCSITGYGQTGPDRLKAGHDLNYCAETGLLSLSGDEAGAPTVPSSQIADIAGGSYPAVMNILLALRRRDRSGEGARLDISMTHNLFALQYWAIAEYEANGRAPRAASSLLNGGSPRYALYRTADGRYIAAAPLEERFWQKFCNVVQLPGQLRDDSVDPEKTRAAVAERIGRQTAETWLSAFGDDCCCALVSTLDEALSNPHFRQAGLFSAQVTTPGGKTAMALDVPLAPQLRNADGSQPAPLIGANNHRLDNGA